MNTRLRNIFSIAIPAIIANVATPLLSMSDMAISGRMGSADFIAAVSLGGVIFNLIYWLLGFLRMGTSGLTAQCFGANNSRGVKITLLRSLSVAVVVGTLIVATSFLFMPFLIEAMGAKGEVVGLVVRYCKICIWGAPAVLVVSSFTGWYVGLQNSRMPMVVSLVMVGCNIALSWALVFLFHFGVEGLACGTLTAQYVGAAMFVVNSRKRISNDRIHLNDFFRWSEFQRFFSLNFDIFLRTLCMVGVTFWFTRVGASQGAVVLAANSLLMQFFTMFSYFMDGFAYAAEAMSGRLFGARHIGELKKLEKTLFVICGVLALLFSAGYFVGGDLLLSILSDEKEVNTKAGEYMMWVATIPLAGFMAFLFDGIAIGLTKTRLMLWSLVISSLVFFAAYFSLRNVMGNHALWLAFVLYLATRGCWLSVVLRRLGLTA